MLLTCCGSKLRTTDALALKEVISVVSQHAAAPDAQLKPRVKFMLEVITDLKHNRRKLVKDVEHEDAAMLLKALRGLVTRRGVPWRDTLRVPLADLLASGSRGRWWLVGSAWAGRDGDGTADAAKGEGAAAATAAASAAGKADDER